MRIAVFSAKPYDRRFLEAAARGTHDFTWIEARLDPSTARLAEGSDAACLFVNDRADAAALEVLAAGGVKLLALRSAGFNHVDLVAAQRLGLAIGRVPAYSPEAVAEHAVALILTLNRNIHRAYNRVREGNFALDGLLGFDLHGRTVGIVGTGQIGTAFARILRGFGCRLLGHDPQENADCIALGLAYRPLEELLAEADIVSVHCPLTPATRHLMDAARLGCMRPGAMLINTSRGAILDTAAVIRALKSGRLGHLGLDVYEEEEKLFFEDLSGTVIADDVFARLLTFPNVLITGHQGFFTEEAMRAIADTTLANVARFAEMGQPLHPVA
ncbi:MAG TPA: 2-hydroxyacid dehydrogenase [Shinella sp.]|jgi:D-lactate dehydrogenase|uniref:2-hydroxyacid dehydrogenase n=1 Tax=Shinella sp. TaxID=1870904 RepID=UPI002E0EB50A|nr:2-hydroxyacid dehydrogenase [Shinella sp.]